MDKFTVIKNGLVLTLDKKGQTGYFNIIIRNGKIFLIDYERKFNEKEFKLKNPESEIIDAKDKLIMPGFFNSKLVSSYSLNKVFFKKCSYQNISSWLSLKLVDRYLTQLENSGTLKDLLKLSYLRSLQNGEIFVNESSISIEKDFFDIHFTDFEWIRQYYNLTSYDYKISPGQEGKISYGFISDENINNYSLSSIRKNLSGKKLKLFIEASLSEKSFDSIKKVFGRSFINVLSDMDLVSADTIISNPTHLNPVEIDILKQRRSSIIISPSDYVNLSYKKIDFDELILSGINMIIGTGYTGNDILSELKIFSTLISRNILSYESILQLAVYNPSLVFGVSNLTGSLERNRSADMIFFDLKDLRNTVTLPDTDRENVSEFIIQNLTSKDISDVLIRGEALIRDGKDQINFIESGQNKSYEISQKLYSAGKYFEFKEKYLMRGRVDKLNENMTEEEEKKEEIFVDMTETGEYVGEGEFTILGAKEDEFEKPRERDIPKTEKQFNLKEIKSLEKDMNLFEGLEDTEEIIKPVKAKKKIVPDKIITEDTDEQKIVIRDVKPLLFDDTAFETGPKF
ncbi:MAG: amidohydrolase family protein [Ignavibacteria bacterium]|nr:amidohydrolase family protein [Ignavibacteria bacterium]